MTVAFCSLISVPAFEDEVFGVRLVLAEDGDVDALQDGRDRAAG